MRYINNEGPKKSSFCFLGGISVEFQEEKNEHTIVLIIIIYFIKEKQLKIRWHFDV